MAALDALLEPEAPSQQRPSPPQTPAATGHLASTVLEAPLGEEERDVLSGGGFGEAVALPLRGGAVTEVQVGAGVGLPLTAQPQTPGDTLVALPAAAAFGSSSSSSPPPPSPREDDYLRLLKKERRTLDAVPGAALSLAHKLITQEMERIQGGGRPPAPQGAADVVAQQGIQQSPQQQQQGVPSANHQQHQSVGTGSGQASSAASSTSPSLARASGDERKIADITKEKPIKVSVRVLVPAKEHPKFNFVGKLLGPKGNSLKRLQEETMTKMAILGRGSMKDKHKEEELRGSGDPRYSHLNEELHVEVTAFAAPAEAHARIAYALAEIRRFLVPDYNDEIRQEQMREMQLMQSADAIELSGGCLEELSGEA
ncbi:KH domain-containing, RNA-binding, signal transduction-associated protein 1-like, partial [Hetaerina americana]|uniref:KH domain-containing, RNA-binding, signal transduction-associated protein 1-like n=1 Tax=Hetaerina americana TaxID=62018 RepID=UPI003A7F1EBD